MEEKNQNIYKYPTVALRGLVLFPKMVLHFDIGREKSINAINEAMRKDRKVFLVAQVNIDFDDPSKEQLYDVGTLAEIKQVVKVKNGLRVMVEGIERFQLVSLDDNKDFLISNIKEAKLKSIPKTKTIYVDALMRSLKDSFEKYCSVAPKMPNEFILSVLISQEPNSLAENITSNIPILYSQKQQILQESNVIKRLELLSTILENESDLLSIEKEIHDKVQSNIDQNQKDYYLREQLKVISEELGDEEDSEEEINEYILKINKLDVNEEVHNKLLKEVKRLSKMPSGSQEAAVIRGYIDECLELPWNIRTNINLNISKARTILDKDHYGMKKVKERILETIAVEKLAPNQKGQILCFVGPPGVGKTSIAESIAKATGRKYARLSLGGVKDESDIRGHRKTYIGSMPGRIIDAIKRAGSKNALILLDEVDKLGNDYKGDPSSALLEVLDSSQNFAFRDHFIELPFDLSEILFIATANNPDNIPAPLYDRMEIIELNSYTREEKYNIAKEFLIPKQLKKNGINKGQVVISNSSLYSLIDNYTKEAGVRSLERTIAKVFRKCATRIVEENIPKIKVDKKDLFDLLGPEIYLDEDKLLNDEIGVANGLAWTSVGGELLQVETAVLDGTGKIELTGQLGDVMKESAQAAVTFIRANSEKYNLSNTFFKDKDIHIHVPEGAVPKDGPSAGITMATSILSALSLKPIRHDVAMTGEITLTGRVLPIGGLKEKSMAAYRNKINTIIIPYKNNSDLVEIDDEVKNHVKFIPVHTVDEVFDIALLNKH